MMKFFTTTFLLFSLGVSVCFGQATNKKFKDAYLEAKKKGDAGLSAFFTSAGEKYANEPDFYSMKSQYLWKKATNSGIVMSTKPAGKGDFVLSDPKTGKQVGSISPGPRKPDEKLSKECAALIKTAIQKFPTRVDFPIGLGAMYFETGNYAEIHKVYQALCDYVAKNPNKEFQGRKGQGGNSEFYEVIKVDPKEAVPGAMHKLCNRFWKFENEVGDENMRQLAELSSQHFPQRPQAWNMLAAYYSFKGDNDKAIGSLEQAHKVAPEDEIVLTNLARFSEKTGKKEKAKIYYQKIIKQTQSATERQKAKAALNRLQSE